MNIVVCIKQVVDTTDIKWTKNNTIDREGVESIVNPCDMLALETALRIKDKNNNIKISVITMGPAQAETALKTSIALGCDEAYLLSDKKFSGADTVATSRTLATAIKKLCPDFDLIICGQYASDGDTAQTGPSIAQKLNIEQITYVTELLPSEGEQPTNIQAIRTTEDFVEVVEAPLPALICVADTPYNARDIRILGYMRAQDYKVQVYNADDIELSREEVGIKGSPTWVSKAFRATGTRLNEVVEVSDVAEAVKTLSAIVKESQSSEV